MQIAVAGKGSQNFFFSEFTLNPSSVTVTKNYWQDTKGYITKDRATVGILSQERFSVDRLLDVLVCQAFTRSIPVRQENGTYMIWGEGSRPWSLRQLASAAGMSVNTVQYGLKRLSRLGLIRRVSNSLGTVVQVVRFYQYRRMNPHVGETPSFDKGHSSFSHQGNTGVQRNDNYRSDPSLLNRSLSNIVVEKEEFVPKHQLRDLARSVLASMT